jgi:glyoxylase-like metal-dependent hydrolase (beta-lactamase superfamily II)
MAKAKVAKRAGRKPKKKSGAVSGRASGSKRRVRIRMYRQGVGDCFLLQFPKQGGGVFNFVIDCGVHQAQSGGGEKMRAVVGDLFEATDGVVDLLAITHEHFDHTSGFLQAAEQWKKIEVKKLWYAWTENPEEPLAQRLGQKRHGLAEALRGLVARQQLAGAPSTRAERIESILGFFGDKAGAKTRQIRAAVDALCEQAETIFLSPGDTLTFPGVAARFYVLGPPKDTGLIKKDDPSKSAPETYGLVRLEAAAAAVESLRPGRARAPFDERFWTPLDASRGIDFFAARYWGKYAPERPAVTIPRDDAKERAVDVEENEQDWRRIDDDWLGVGEQLALQLDQATNNTSLVLAIELPGKKPGQGDVLLFAADAQVGNWLSWQDVRFTVEGTAVTGPQLLANTVLYKVGHHGSHNATLKDKGLEQMTRLETALMPTDEEMASKVKWDEFPWPDLVTRLGEKVGKKLIRSDAPKLEDTLPDPPFYEVEF